MTDVPAGFDTGRANIARVYDYMLGGKDNYAADRALAEELLAQQPGIQCNARSNRAFMQRVVRTIAAAGIDQFLDIGTGMPTGENVHQVASAVNPGVQVVYVDNDEVVAAHSRALLASQEGVEFLLGDLREPAKVLEQATALDFSRPVALLIISMLHFVPDDDEAKAIISELTARLAPGSYLAMSHWIYHPDDEQIAKRYAGAVHALARRSHEQIAALLPAGWETVEPGLVPVTAWRPEPSRAAAPETPQVVGGVVRKP